MIKDGDKLYVVVRQDINPGYQIAQSCHAVRQFTDEHPEIDARWYEVSKYIAVLGIPNEEMIESLVDRCLCRGIKFSAYREPDMDDQITAVAIEPGVGRFVTGSLPLALKGVGTSGP